MEKLYLISYKITTFFFSASAVLLIFIAYAEITDIAATAAPQTHRKTSKTNNLEETKTSNKNPIGSTTKEKQKPPAASAGFSIKVEATEAKREHVENNINTVGTIYSNESVDISPEVAGKIVDIHFKNGEEVNKNSLLFSLESSIQKAELNKTLANLSLVQNNVNRYSRLVKSGASSRLQLEDAIANLKLAKANVQAARAALAKTKITSPFSGKIGIRKVSIGNFVNIGQKLVSLDQTSPLKIRFSVAEKFIHQVQKESVILFSTSNSEKLFSAPIKSIDSRISEENRGFMVEAITENDSKDLFPGQFVSINLKLGSERDSVTIPSQAVIPLGDKNYVFKVIDNKVEKYEVKIKARSVNNVEVEEGILEGETIVTAGHQKLRDGTSVRVVEPTYVKLNFMDKEKKVIR